MTAASSPAPRRATEREGPLIALKTMLEIIVVAFFVTTFIVQPFRIPTGSMEPTLRVGDFLLVDKQSFAPPPSHSALSPLPPTPVQRGDLAVFHFPVDPAMHLVKRIVGLPGDRIRLRGGHVWINGQPLAEPYAFYSPSRPNFFRDDFPSLREADPNVQPPWWIAMRQGMHDGEMTVPPEQYFVLGDNRNDSEDSRYWGFVPRNALVGRPLLVYFSLPPTPQAPTPLRRLLASLHFGLTSARILR